MLARHWPTCPLCVNPRAQVGSRVPPIPAESYDRQVATPSVLPHPALRNAEYLCNLGSGQKPILGHPAVCEIGSGVCRLVSVLHGHVGLGIVGLLDLFRLDAE